VIDLAALQNEIRRIAREERARPDFVHQRNVETVVGLPRRDYLRMSRANAWHSHKHRRLVIARTSDVIAYLETHIGLREYAPANVVDIESATLARVGARRIA
jgi:hypothetical protein